MVRYTIVGLTLLLGVGCGFDALPHPQLPPLDPGIESPAGIPAVMQVFVLDGVLCSAVVVGPAEAITARHCVVDSYTHEPRLPVALVGFDDTRYVDPAEVLVSHDRDLALVHIKLDGTQALFDTYASVAEAGPALGGNVWVAGFGCSGFKSLGIRPARLVGASDAKHDDYIGRACPGDSGGGVFNDDGELVGISSAVGTGSGNAGHVYAAPLYR